MPGSKLLMVTLWRTVWRASPAMKPMSPERAPFDNPASAWGLLTVRALMLTMRPNLRGTIGVVDQDVGTWTRSECGSAASSLCEVRDHRRYACAGLRCDIRGREIERRTRACCDGD